MLVLTIKTDSRVAEIGLYKDKTKLQLVTFEAHQILAESLHLKIMELLKNQNYNWPDIQGIVCYVGPGSFTGLRIGLSLANALAYANNIPIVGSRSEDWKADGLEALISGHNQKLVMPFYGSEPHITKRKK